MDYEPSGPVLNISALKLDTKSDHGTSFVGANWDARISWVAWIAENLCGRLPILFLPDDDCVEIYTCTRTPFQWSWEAPVKTLKNIFDV